MTLTLDGTLLLAGAGNMGSAMLAGWLDRGLDPKQIIVQDPSPPARVSELIAKHAGRQTAEVYGSPDRLAEVRAAAQAQRLAVRPAGPAVAIVGAEKADNGAVPDDAVLRAASLEDVFVLLTGEEAE